MKAKTLRLGLRQRAPVAERLLEQHECADHIGLDERSRPVDRTVDMAFRRQMHDHVGLEISERRLHRSRIGNVGSEETKARMILDRLQRVEVARVGQLVDDEDIMAGRGEDMPHQGGADESCPARHQKTLRHQAPIPAYAKVCRRSIWECSLDSG